MQKIILSILLFLGHFTVGALILESFSFEQILSKVDQDTLLVLDLDNTVLEPKQQLGSDQWFEYFLNKKMQEGLSSEAALAETLTIYVSVQNKTDVNLVEKNTAKIIDNLYKKNIEIIALTTRGNELEEATIRQLTSVGINFNRGKFYNNRYIFRQNSRGLVNSGVIYAGGVHKGDSLMEYLSHLNWLPKKITFVDDKHKNILHVEEQVTKYNIEFIGMRYGYLDEKVKKLNIPVTNIQLEAFNNIISDQYAEAVLNNMG